MGIHRMVMHHDQSESKGTDGVANRIRGVGKGRSRRGP